MANGHPDAMQYTVGWILDEAVFVKERLTILDANQAVWTKRAIAAVLSRDGAKEFEKQVKGASNGTKG